MIGTLYIVATPIGNLGDMSLRAIDVLKAVDLILCEDTRVTKKLLDKFGIATAAISYHQHSTIDRADRIAALLEEGKNLALVSDAGTPGISDPGNLLIERLVGSFHGAIRVIPVPGPSAVAAALSICGFASDRFAFLGFPPAKNKRRKFFEELLANEFPVAIYESPYRIIKTLKELDAANANKQRRVIVCRELTKQFETVYRGTFAEVAAAVAKDPVKGEFVVVIDGARFS